MDLSPDFISALNAASPYVALIVIVVLFIGLLYFGMRSMNVLASSLRGFADSQQQVVVALATLTTSQQGFMNKLNDVDDRNQTVVEQISQLRLDLDKHIVAINVRFDQLPTKIQEAVIGEWMRYAQNGGAHRRGLLARLFG